MSVKEEERLNADDEPPYTVKETAYHLGLEPPTIRKWIYQRKIDYLKISRNIRIPRRVVKEILAKAFRPAI